jgi:Domain of unknown function (DUF697)
VNGLRYLLTVLAALALLTFAVFVTNETYQVVMLASTVSPLLGRIVGAVLVALYVVLLALPLLILWRMPRALLPPQRAEGPEYEAYCRQVAARLKRNPLVCGRAVSAEDAGSIEAALTVLDEAANSLIRATASTVFVTTAISQNGRLDGLMVLVTQSRMVWQVAHVYNQRPDWRELLDLYANVAACAFLATRLEDLDLTAQVQPIIASAIGVSMAGAVPMATTLATILTNALVEGSANAFLTLRVGVLARRQCRSLVRVQQSWLRRNATVEAAGLLGGIVVNAAGVVTSAVANAALKPVAQAANGVRSAASGAVKRVRGATGETQ